VNLTDFVIHAGIEKNAFGGGGLAGIDMSADTNIPIAVDGSLAGHLNLLLIGWSFETRTGLEGPDGGSGAKLYRASWSLRWFIRIARRQGLCRILARSAKMMNL
jgi:hypothetical protein